MASVSIMPGYEPGVFGDDAAVLTLAQPFDPGPDIASVPVAGAGQQAPVGSTGVIYGWGQSSPGQVDGFEHYLDMTVGNSWDCDFGEPSYICASSSTGDTCSGDSGAGLIEDKDGTPMLFGVLDTIDAPTDELCTEGHQTGFTDVTSPQVAEWLQGVAPSPLAPVVQSVAGETQAADPYPGGWITCTPPSFSDAATVNVLFVDSGSDTVLQDSTSDKYVIPASEQGRTVGCVFEAINAGGVTYLPDGFLLTIGAAPPPPVPPATPSVTTATTPTTPSTTTPTPTVTAPIATRPEPTTAGPSVEPKLKLAIARGTAVPGNALTAQLPVVVVTKLAGKVVSRAPFAPGSFHRYALKPTGGGRFSICLNSESWKQYKAASVCTSWVHPRRISYYLRIGGITTKHDKLAVVLDSAVPLKRNVLMTVRSMGGQLLVRQQLDMRHGRATVPLVGHPRRVTVSVVAPSEMVDGARSPGATVSRTVASW